MPLFRMTPNSFERVSGTSFIQEGLRERQDLQRLLRADISVIDPSLMVIAEEFSEWEDSSRRIDLLCLDQQARLVVIEIKRTEDGGHMELQAIRYAAMVSAMTLEQLINAHARYIKGEDAYRKAEAAVLSHLGFDTPSDVALTGEVRTILIASDFSKEITTSVMWLNTFGLDITCIRLRPFRVDNHLLIDLQQIIPLPEAAEYETKLRAQKEEKQRAESTRHEARRKFWAGLIERSRGRTTVVSNRKPTERYVLGSQVRPGISLNFGLLQDECEVFCYIDLGPGKEEATKNAFKALEAQKDEIEAAYGDNLVWEPLETRRASRISKGIEGGWKAPESEWPGLQIRLIETMARFELAIRRPIQDLKI